VSNPKDHPTWNVEDQPVFFRNHVTLDVIDRMDVRIINILKVEHEGLEAFTYVGYSQVGCGYCPFSGRTGSITEHI
jgi:hypothetical protein